MRSLKKNSAGFADLAGKHSATLAKEGGLRGEITRGMLSEDVTEAAFALQPGEISGVIESTTAWFILKVEGRKKGNADDFEDPKVRMAAERLLAAQTPQGMGGELPRAARGADRGGKNRVVVKSCRRLNPNRETKHHERRNV